MYCKKCGKEIDEGVHFCPSCGSNINEQDENVAVTEVAPKAEGTQSKTPKKGKGCSKTARIFVLIHSWIAVASMALNAVMAVVSLVVGIIQSIINSIITKITSFIVDQFITAFVTAFLGEEYLADVEQIEQMVDLFMLPLKLIQFLSSLMALPGQIASFLLSVFILLLNVAVAIFGFIFARRIRTAPSKKSLTGWAIACIVICVIMQANTLSVVTGPLGIVAGLLGIIAGVLVLCSGEHEYGIQ